MLLIVEKLLSILSLSLFIASWSSMVKNILVTGGAGYIGSHAVLQLLLRGYTAVVIDNLDNSSLVSIQRVKELAGDRGDNLAFHQVCPFLRLDD